jgi:Helix-turn-helix domain of resolvase
MSSQVQLTKRQQEVLERVERGEQSVRQIAKDIGVTRAAVYQIIERLRTAGALPADFTVSGVSSADRKLAASRRGWTAPARSRLAEVRELAAAGGDERRYADALAAAIADRDVLSLAYLLGRTDAGEGEGLTPDLVGSALRQLGALGGAQDEAEAARFEGAKPGLS